MKAIVYDDYGGPERLRMDDVAPPEPRADEVLIQVEAVALNASDVEFLRGAPAYVRMWGLRRPRYRVLGSDVAGRVVAVGRDVTQLRPGDAVLTDTMERWGGLAEFLVASESKCVRKPEGLSFEQAAATPQSGVLALQALLRGNGPAGERVLINGAGGGAGTFAVQLARNLGAAEITAVDRGPKLARLRALGADHVLDYAETDFAQTGARYDRIVDFVATRPMRDCARALAPRGQYLLVGGDVPHLLGALFLGALLGALGGKKLGVFAHRQHPADLTRIAELCAAGSVTPVIDRVVPLAAAPEAFRDLLEGRVFGKVVLTPGASAKP